MKNNCQCGLLNRKLKHYKEKYLMPFCFQGKTFCIWKMSDLNDDSRTTGFFLFGQVYKQLWKTSIGAVLGILNPNIMDTLEKVCLCGHAHVFACVSRLLLVLFKNEAIAATHNLRS